jgi:hypothetical protein
MTYIMSCNIATEERKRCSSQLDYKVEGKDGELECSEYCFDDCKGIITNVMANRPKRFQFRFPDGSLLPENNGYFITAVNFTLSTPRVDLSWSATVSIDGQDNWEFAIVFPSNGAHMLRSRGFDIMKDYPDLDTVTRSFCYFLASVPIGIAVILKVNLLIDKVSVSDWKKIKIMRDKYIQPVFPDYGEGRYLYKKKGWHVDASERDVFLTADINFTRNNQVQVFGSVSENIGPKYQDFSPSKYEFTENPMVPEREIDLSHYVSRSAKARVLDDVTFCSNPKDFFTQDELEDVTDGDIITFILRPDKKKKPLVVCLDKDSLFDYWKLNDSGQGWLYGRCQNETEPYNCNKFYKIPGDITLLIDEAAKNTIVTLWNSKLHYTMFELSPLEKVKIGRGLHYVGEAGGDQMIYDAVPVALYIKH